ncbi:MAG: hypothetical protein IIY28_09625 [Lachnospiraceae bacterium]|nr:hypothetical protein [Lachnospiraceae bacterium]
MWVQCNPNPLGKQTGDCVIRAIAIATDQSWRQTYRALCDEGERLGDLPNSNQVWGNYLRQHGAKQFLLPETCPTCISVRAFCDRYPEGVYVIGTGDHAVAVIDGDHYDSFDSGEMTPTYFWRVK